MKFNSCAVSCSQFAGIALCVYVQATVVPETICVWLHLLTYLIRYIQLAPFSPQISCEWCVIGCAQTTGAGARGPTSASPADISDEAAPASSPATSSTGEQSVRKHFFFSSSDALWFVWADLTQIIKMSFFFPWTSDHYGFTWGYIKSPRKQPRRDEQVK